MQTGKQEMNKTFFLKKKSLVQNVINCRSRLWGKIIIHNKVIYYVWAQPMSMLQNSCRLHRVPTPKLLDPFCSSIHSCKFKNLTESNRKLMNCK